MKRVPGAERRGARRDRTLATLLATTLLLAGCGARGRSAPVASPGAGDETPALTRSDVLQVAKATSSARSLAIEKPLDVVMLEPTAFRNVLRQQAREDDDDLARSTAFGLAFNFIPSSATPPGKSGDGHDVADAVADDILGYYDTKLGRIVVPKVPIRSQHDWIEQRAVLAHETQHALQAQHFASIFRDLPESDDARLARLSLVEGDAMLAMGAFLGSEVGAPVNRTMRRIREITKQVALEKLVHGSALEKSPDALALAPSYVRQTVEFPYEAGMFFVSDVFRTGGYELVDRMYASPPISTEQILHPDKYLEGERPREIRPFSIDPQSEKIVANSLGELGIRLALEPCASRSDASRAAAGWDGDRFEVVKSRSGALTLLWLTAWDSEEDAEEFASAIQAADGCFKSNQAGSMSFGARRSVERRGKLVAVLRGDDKVVREHASWSAWLFEAAGPEQPSVPLTEARVPPREPLPEPEPGELRGDVYSNPWLGIVARVPPGMHGTVGSEGAMLSIEREGAAVRGSVFLSERIATAPEIEKSLAEFQRGFLQAVPEVQNTLTVASTGSVTTPRGAGTERTWTVPGTALTVRAVLVPICADSGSVVFVQLAGDRKARAVLDGWVQSFRWAHGRAVTACQYLDPK